MPLSIMLVGLSSFFALLSALFLYLSSSAQTLLRKPLPRKIGWGVAGFLWVMSWGTLWRSFSFPAAFSMAFLMLMLGCILVAFLSGLLLAVNAMRPCQSSHRDA